MQISKLRNGLLLGACALAALGWSADLSGYSLTGRTWASSSILYYVNPQNARGLTQASIVDSLQRAANVWSDQSRANIALSYAGTTSGGSFTLNYKNEVFFRNEAGAVASTYWWYDGTGRLVDFDMALYDGGYTFYPTNTTCTDGVYIDNVAVHEFGHGLGLNHSSIAGSSMYPSMSGYCDVTQLTLDGDDITGIEAAYPAAVAVQAPAAPGQLAVARNASNPTTALNLTWGDSSNNESGFRIERSTDGWSFSQVAQVGQNATSWVNTGLTSGVTYAYRVYAYNSGGSSAYSPVASAQTDVVVTASQTPQTPSQLAASRNASSPTSALNVTWADSSSNESGFRVERSTNGSSFSQVAQVGQNVTSFVNSGLSSGATYYYRVRAFNGAGTSPYTNTAAGQTATVTSVVATPSADGTRVPSASQIVDAQGAVWTIGSGGVILRNGASAAGGYGSQILWSGGTIYVLGTGSIWYRWTGSTWATASAPTAGPSADGTQVPSVSQIVDAQGAVWMIGSGGAILRNGASAAGGLGSQILWSGGTIYVLGTGGVWYRWTGSGWTTGVPATTTSRNGTQVPNASQIVDSQGAVWTIGSGGVILRNGASAAGGYGSQILWSGGTIYVLGTGSIWYRWTGSGWTTGAPATTTSPDGTQVPNASQIVDVQGAVWTIGYGGAILRNGASAAGGLGLQILWSGGTIYVLGTGSVWYRWTGSGWTTGVPATATTTSPDGTQVPNASQIVDAQGAIWTIGSGGAILRNGAHAAGGLGSQILWSGGAIYVFGTTNSWYRWTGSAWVSA